MASQDGGQFVFQTADFVLLGIITGVSVLIGIYHAFTGGRQKTTSEYLLGNRHMQVIPVAVSLLVSFQSAVLMIGFPAEMYVYGTMLWLFVLTAISANVLSAILLVPLFQPLKLVTVYEVYCGCLNPSCKLIRFHEKILCQVSFSHYGFSNHMAFC